MSNGNDWLGQAMETEVVYLILVLILSAVLFTLDFFGFIDAIEVLKSIGI